MKNSKRFLIVLLVLAFVTAGLFAQGQTEAAAAESTTEKTTIKVAYHPHITGVGGLLNAIDNGYFEEENLEVELALRELEVKSEEIEKWDGKYVSTYQYGPIPVTSGSLLGPSSDN